MIPLAGPYINSGIWSILIEPVKVVTGQYYLYLPSSAIRNESTGFYRAAPQVTLTIPSTAAKVILWGPMTAPMIPMRISPAGAT